MNPKYFIEMFPYGYKRLRNQNGSIALTLDTKCAEGFIFIKKVPKNRRIPKINQKEMDNLQLDCRGSSTIIDWFNDEACRYFIIMQQKNELAVYRIVLNAFFGEETFEVIGDFFEKKDENHRKKIYNERYLKHIPPNALTTETDFTNEQYDIIFPDDPLSHCRRLGNVIAMNSICPQDTHVQKNNEIGPADYNPFKDNNETKLD